jgi:hypothetical protein
MKEDRWLLPFTFGVDVHTIDFVLRSAKECGAVVVAASLIVIPKMRQVQGPRLEYIQQSKDFLEVVRWKAEKHQVSVELHEVWTADLHERIKRLVLDLHCSSIVVVTNGKGGVLLDVEEIKKLLVGDMSASLVLIRIPASEQRAIEAHLGTRLFSWTQKFLGQRSASIPKRTVSIDQGLAQKKLESTSQRTSP